MGQITGVVVQKNSFQYSEGENLGRTMPVPIGVDADLHGEYWAVPKNEGGVFRGWNFVKAVDAPTYDAFKVVKVVSNVSSQGDTLWILGSEAQYLASSADEGTTPLPLASTIPVYILEEPSCIKNGANFQWEWTAPTLGSGIELRVYAAVNGVRVTSGQAEAAGFANVGAAVTWLNASASSAGTWSNPSGSVLRLVRATEATVGVTFITGNFTP